MTPWVMRLIIANVAMFFLSRAVPGASTNLALVPALLPWRPWTLITYMFLHADGMHLLFNMLSLFFFGPRLEARLGGARFLQLYFVSGLTGGLLFVATSAAMPLVAVVGASGATFGVSLGFARYWPRTQVMIWGVIPVEARVLIVIMTVMALFGAGGFAQPGVAHFAHLGGFLGGWLYLRVAESRAASAAFRAAATPAPRPASPDAVQRWRQIDRAALHPVNAEELDRVLGKLDTHGAQSLSADERAFLERLAS